MNRLFRKITFILVGLGTISCSGDAHLDKSALSKWLATDDIEVTCENRKLHVVAKNPKGVDNRPSPKDSILSAALEELCSTGAVLTIAQIEKAGLQVDSVMFEIVYKLRHVKFTYSYNDLKEIRTYCGVCVAFTDAINKGQIDSVKSFLSDDILKEASDSDIDKLINNKSLFPCKITEANMMGFVLENRTTSLYTNLHFENKAEKLLQFNFRFGSNKIIGIQIP